MGLQRTPPTRSQPLPSASPQPPPPPSLSTQESIQPQPAERDVEIPIQAEEEGNKTIEADKTTSSTVSDSKAFISRRPGVMRTPPPGEARLLNVSQQGRTQHVDERPIRPAPTPSPVPEYRVEKQPEMDVEPMEVDINVNVQINVIDKDIRQNQIEQDERETENLLEDDTLIIEDDSNLMDIDDQNQEQQHKSTTPPPSPPPTQPVTTSVPQYSTTPSSQAGPSSIPIPPTTPSSQSIPKTPRSRRKTIGNDKLPSPPKPLPLETDQEYEFGRRYQLTIETLERAVKAGAQRWTAEHLKGCFPQLSKELGKGMENTCLSASQSMRNNILRNVHAHLEHYKVGPSLKSIDQVDKEAREYQKANPPDSEVGKLGRPDAWRPDISPDALVTSSILPIYDENYLKLREEYLGLHQYCSDKYKSIIEKQNQLNEFENGVSDGVIELEKTIGILDKLPIEDMMIWTEAAETKLETRAPEQIQ